MKNPLTRDPRHGRGQVGDSIRSRLQRPHCPLSQAKMPAGSWEPAMILKQWGNNTMSFVSEELGENREFLTYAIPEENAA